MTSSPRKRCAALIICMAIPSPWPAPLPSPGLARAATANSLDSGLAPTQIANRIKAKGLQKLRWYCQMCGKQCRDENGFKCHLSSDSHQRQMMVFGQVRFYCHRCDSLGLAVPGCCLLSYCKV